MAVGLSIGLAATAADVGSNLMRGNCRGVIVAGTFGLLGARTGVAGNVLKASKAATIGVEGAMTGLGLWAGALT